MLQIILMALPFLLPLLAQITNDPAPGLTLSKTESRNLQCVRMSEEGARELHPGLIGASSPRGDYLEVSAVVCHERIMHDGERPVHDEAILSGLSPMISDIVSASVAAMPEAEGKTILVEVFYPDRAIAAKIAFATKNALLAKGRKVSDRVPSLAAGDIDVLTRLKPQKAYPLACNRYFAEGRLSHNDVVLAIVQRDSRETILHAGLCVSGEWRWLR
ncbi:hypothetical protein KAI87_15160 [Myxococcota bacterium]|nr:hypothetical protein [Myxococcota bacterium]